MKTSIIVLKSLLSIFFLTLSISSFSQNYYWTGAVNGSFTNISNWGDGLGGPAPANGSTGQPLPDVNSDVYFQNTVGASTIDCTGGACRNIFVTNAGSQPYIFENKLDVYGSINSPVDKLMLDFGSKIVFYGNGIKTILLINSIANQSHVDFEFYGNGSYSLSGSLDSFGNTGLFNIHDNVQVSSNGNDLALNTIKFTAPAVSASLNLNNSNVNLYEGIFYGEFNGTLAPGPGVSVTALNTNLELGIIYNNSSAQSLIGLERILFRPGQFFPVSSWSNMTIQSDTVYVNSNKYDANADLSCYHFELLQRCDISGAATGAIRFNDFVVPSACGGLSSLNFLFPVSNYTIQNTSISSIETIEMLFKNVTNTGFTINSNITNDQGGNSGITWTPAPAGASFYWVGGSGDWSDGSHWSINVSNGNPSVNNPNGCIPTLLDDVYFDGSSFLLGPNVTNVNSAPLFSKNVYWIDPGNVGGIIGGNFQQYNWYIAGSADFSGMNPLLGAKADLIMIGSDPTHTFTAPAMPYERGVWFNGTGTYTLQNDITVQTLSHGQGTLNTNGVAVTCSGSLTGGGFNSQPLTPTSLRSLNISNSFISIYSGGIVSSGMVAFSANGSEIELTEPSSFFYLADGLNVSLASMILPKISYTSTSGTPVLTGGSTVISISDMYAFSNLDQRQGSVSIDNLYLAGGTTIQVYSIKIGNTLNVSGSSCADMVTFVNGFNTTIGDLFKPTGTFTVERAYLRNISANPGVPLTVTNGIDGGNNLNISFINSLPSRDFYWVGNSGNWNDGGHWSIGVPGVPAISTNPNGCIPTANDNVFFQNDSFNAFFETVSIGTDANCKNIDWTGSGSWSPILAGTSTPSMNVHGSFILTANLTWNYQGPVKMYGINTTANSQLVNFNGVSLSSPLRFMGGGRYDLASDLTITGVASTVNFLLQEGSVYTNGFDINTTYMRLFLDVAANYFDATNSTITSANVLNTHGATNNYNFVNSTFVNTTGAIGITITTPSTANYHNFLLGGTSLNSNGTVTAQNVTRTAAITTTTGNWVMDTLVLAKSSDNTFQAGRTYTVNDTLIAFGTPCIPVILKANGGTATYESTSLNTLVNFGSIQNMTASLVPGGASSADYQVIGVDAGGNSNWTFAPAASLPYLGAYNVSANCDGLPYGVSTAGFSPVPGSTYAWSNGSTASSITIDTSGVYSVAVTYAPNCTVIDSIEFSIANTLDVQSTSVVMPGCFEDSTGTISTNILGGNNNFEYTWTSPTGNTFTINPTDSTQLSDLAAGDYQIIVNQTNNPACADTLTIAISEPTLLTPDLTVSNLACNGDTDGSISATGNGGTPGYQVSLDGGGFNLAPFNFSGLNAGSYEIVVQDLNGCLDTIIQSIIQPTVLAASGSNTPVLCNGDANGSVDLTVNGGTPTYNVSVNGGAFAPSSPTYGGLIAGNYELIIEDQNGCRDTINQIVTEPAVLLTSTVVTSSYNGSDVSCNGLTDASISSSTNGGTINYSYSWNTSPIQTTQNISGVGAGSYTVTVTDQNNCTAQSTVNVTEPAVLSDTYVVDQNANCNVADGEATITTLGGNPGYIYAWSNNAGNNTNSATDLPAGITNVTITDANGCTDNISITVNSINAPLPYVSADSVLCLGGSTGVAIVDSVSGNGGYTYIWSDNSGNPIGQTTSSATGLTAGTYSVQVIDQNGCSSIETIIVEEPATSVAISVLNVTIPACNSTNEGSITVSASGGTGAIGYSWDTSPIQTTASISNLPEGSYTVTVTDQNGCTTDETVQITAPTPLTLTFVQNDVSCFEGNDGEVLVTTQGGTPNYNYTWTGSTSTTSDATGLTVGNYAVFVTDANGCSDSLDFVVTEPTLLQASVLSTTDGDCGAPNGVIEIEVTGGSPIYSYQWNDGNTNQNNSSAQSGLNTVVITDQNGCEQTLEVDMSCLLFEIPEFLTPNGDDYNDTWAITGLENFPNTEVVIFNRWGTEVYSSDDYTNDWDGTSQSSLNVGGDKLPESSYYYILTLGGDETDVNSGKVFKGYIYIKRN